MDNITSSIKNNIKETEQENEQNSTTRSIKVMFRFLSLNRMQSFTLNKELMDAYCIEVKEKKQYIGMVPLTPMSLNDIIDFYIKQQLQLDDCDINIRVEADAGNEYYQVPNIVSDMLKHIDCSMSVVVEKN